MVGKINAFALGPFKLNLTIAGAIETFAMSRAISITAQIILITIHFIIIVIHCFDPDACQMTTQSIQGTLR